MHRNRFGRSAWLATATYALAGAVLAAGLTFLILINNIPTTLVMNSPCIPPCPQSTVTYGTDWLTGRRWETITTVDVDGRSLGSRVINSGAPRYRVPYDLLGPGLAGAAIAAAAQLLVGRLRRSTRGATPATPEPDTPEGY